MYLNYIDIMYKMEIIRLRFPNWAHPLWKTKWNVWYLQGAIQTWPVIITKK